MRPYIDLTDEELIADIKAVNAGKRKAMSGQISEASGEGRKIVYAPSNMKAIDQTLRDLAYEARQRGLPIGGSGGALLVEIG